MSATVVTTQAEFDAAVTAGADWIRIESPAGVWIEVSTPRDVDVEASGSASVRASGSASVRAFDSASVRAFDSASVRAFDSASVRAFDSASVRAFGSASVRASGSASVSAFGSASVSAFGSASVSAFDSASVRASSKVAVHLHSGQAHVDGGVLIDHTDVDLTDVPTWLEYRGITVDDGVATFYKAVDQDLYAGHGWTPTRYPIGETVTAPDWDPAQRCGHGLHATGDPGLSETYFNGHGGCRYLELAVPVDGLVVLDDKVKFESCTVVREVTVTGIPLESAEQVAQ